MSCHGNTPFLAPGFYYPECYPIFLLPKGHQSAISALHLNRGEGRHSLARDLFHGKRGELRQRHREGQEDQLSALGLVVNIIVLWNTIYIDAALDQLRPFRNPNDTDA